MNVICAVSSLSLTPFSHHGMDERNERLATHNPFCRSNIIQDDEKEKRRFSDVKVSVQEAITKDDVFTHIHCAFFYSIYKE